MSGASMRGRPGPRDKHAILQVGFTGHVGPSDSAPIDCECGWSGQVIDYNAHKGGTTFSGSYGPAGPSYFSGPFSLKKQKERS